MNGLQRHLNELTPRNELASFVFVCRHMSTRNAREALADLPLRCKSVATSRLSKRLSFDGSAASNCHHSHHSTNPGRARRSRVAAQTASHKPTDRRHRGVYSPRMKKSCSSGNILEKCWINENRGYSRSISHGLICVTHRERARRAARCGIIQWHE